MSRIENLKGILIPLIGFLLAIVLFVGIIRKWRDEYSVRFEVIAPLRETIIYGATMGGMILNYEREMGHFPDLAECEELVRTVSTTHEVFAEMLSNSGERSMLKLVADGRGGWVYNPADGSLRLNLGKRVFLDKGATTWLVPSEVNFTDRIAIVLHGVTNSTALRIATELNQLAVDNRGSARAQNGKH